MDANPVVQKADTLQELVPRAARTTPDAPAVVGPDQTLTYADLDGRADRFGAGLTARGVAPGDRVVVWTDKSAEAVALMQGALRIGAVYVPVTGSNPPARVAKIAADSAAALVVADDPQLERMAGAPEAGTFRLAGLTDLLASSAGHTCPTVSRRPDDPAYILYTSGSTGAPKGVSLSHRNALAFVEWAVELVGVGPTDRLGNHAPFNFDLSVFDLYAAFHTGASVHLVPAELAYAPTELVRFIHDRQLTVWYSVPSALALMMREGGLLTGPPPAALRACVFAGEPFPIRQVQELRKAWPDIRLFNWYGPTETNVCTSYEVTDADLARTGPLPIGTAASGDTIVLDPGPDEGEVVVDGPTVMLGYWGREPQQGAYRTGDHARLTNGVLEYHGRLDHMVKIRGNRIELGEVEAALEEHPDLARVVAVVVGDGLTAALHAVAVPAGARRPGPLEVRRWCSDRLPAYMIVDTVHYTDTLPLTPNGKADRAAVLAAVTEGGL